MELFRIGEKKLKVTLSDADMERYSLDGETIDYDTTETRSAFWQILNEAKEKTGFDAGGGRLFVQVYASRGGGCEMFVTLMEGDLPRQRKKRIEVRGHESVYRFSELSLLLTVCRKLSELGYHEESSVYTEGGAYFLVIRERLESSIMSPKALGEFSFIEEYGERLAGASRLLSLREHASCLEAHEAVSRLSPLL